MDCNMNMNIMNIILYDYLSRRGINSIISLSLSLSLSLSPQNKKIWYVYSWREATIEGRCEHQVTDDFTRYVINRCSPWFLDDQAKVRVSHGYELRLTSPLSRSSLEFAKQLGNTMRCPVLFPVFARERTADSLQRKTGFHSFIAAYRVFTGSWPAGAVRTYFAIVGELWDR